MTHDGSDLQFEVLGTLRVRGPDGLVTVGGPRVRGLLGILIANVATVVRTDQILDQLWDDHPPSSAAGTLHANVSRLRKALAHAGDPAVVVTHPAGYELAVDPLRVDAVRLTRVVRSLARSPVGPEEAVRQLDDILTSWRGVPYSDLLPAAWAVAESERLELAHLDALAARVEARLALGQHAAVVGELEALVVAHPFREDLWAQLMIALYRSGRQGEALRTFTRLRTILADELGIDPSQELVRLERDVLNQSASLDLAQPPLVTTTTDSDLVGRDAPIAALRRAWYDTVAGRGGTVVVMGEPGIGKTSLVNWLASEVQGGTVIRGRWYDGDAGGPYGAIAEACASTPADLAAAARQRVGPAAALLGVLVPEWAARTDEVTQLQPDMQRHRFIDAVTRYIAALTATAPVLMVLDDLHWVDHSSLVLLGHLSRLAGRDRLLLVLACRSTEIDDQHPVSGFLRAARREPGFAEIGLSGLGVPEVAALAGRLTDRRLPSTLARELTEQTAGNPLFISEIAQYMHDRPIEEWAGALSGSGPVPQGIRSVMAERVSRMTPEAALLLSVGAVRDRPFTLEGARMVAGMGPDEAVAAVEAAIGGGLLVPADQPDSYWFFHVVGRQCILASQSPSRQIRMHRRWAEVLAAGSGPPSQVARHYRSSAALPGAEAGVRYAIAAADQAERSGAFEEAVDALETALELAPEDDPIQLDCRRRLGLTLPWCPRHQEAPAVALQAAAGIAEQDGAEAAADYLAAVTEAIYLCNNDTEAWELAQRGLAYRPDRQSPSWARLVFADIDRRDAVDAQSAGIPRDHADRAEAARVMLRALESEANPTLTPYAQDLAYAFDSRQEILDSRVTNANLRVFWAGDLRQGAESLAEMARDAEHRGQLAWAGLCHNNEGRCRSALGQFEAARAAAAQAVELWERSGYPLSLGMNLLAGQDEYCLARGEGFMDNIDSEFLEDPKRRWAVASYLAAAARVFALLGDPDGAMTFFESAVPSLTVASGAAILYVKIACDLASVLWTLDRRDHLEVIQSALRVKVLGPDFRYPAVDARLCMGRLAALDRRPDEARRWFASSRQVLDEQGARPLRAVVDLDEATMLIRLGLVNGGGELAKLLDLAVEKFAALDMPGWLRRAEQLAR